MLKLVFFLLWVHGDNNWEKLANMMLRVMWWFLWWKSHYKLRRATIDKAILCLISALCSSCSFIQIEKGGNKKHTATDYWETLSWVLLRCMKFNPFSLLFLMKDYWLLSLSFRMDMPSFWGAMFFSYCRSANYSALVKTQLLLVALHMVVFFLYFLCFMTIYILLQTSLASCYLVSCHCEGWTGTYWYWCLAHYWNNSREKEYRIQVVYKLTPVCLLLAYGLIKIHSSQ